MKAFHTKKLKCPICTKEAEYTLLTSEVFGLYYPASRDRDQYVSQWNWRDPQWSHINPYHYAIILCPICHYSDFEENFGDSPKELSIRQIKFLRKIMTALPATHVTLIKDIAWLIDNAGSSRTPEIATLSYILALAFQQYLLEDKSCHHNYNLLGRMFLRLAWMYRQQEEAGTHANSALQENQPATPSTVCYSMLDSLAHYSSLSNELLKYYDNIPVDNAEEVQSMIHILDKNIAQVIKKTQALAQAINKGTESGHSNIHIIFNNIYSVWTWMPRTENDAINSAISHFEEMAQKDSTITDNALWKLLELLAFLYDKTGNIEKRNNRLSHIISASHRKRMLLSKKLQLNISTAERAELELDLKKINNYIQEITFQYKYDYNENASV